MKPSYYIKTFGCQMNEHDSEKMAILLRRGGYSRTLAMKEADLIVINTCSIREKSYQKAVSEIGRIGHREGRGRPVVAVTGCVVSHDGENLLKRFPFIDMVLGPDHEASLPRLVKQVKAERERVNGGRFPSAVNDESGIRSDVGLGARAVSRPALIDFQDISDYEFPSEIAWNGPQKKVKAYVTIMKGCDNVCSFCIVPFVRGKEVSRPSADVIDEVRRLEEQGVREVMLLGQNVNSYGKGLREKTHFAKLLRRIDEETSIARIRFTSPHPKDLSDELIGEYTRNEKLCPHIHLPVQAGSNRVLKRMRRSYTREAYLRKVEKLRKAVPEIAVTTDLIVGFPGETERDFEETLSLMREVNYDASYSFAFSPRPNTEAATFADDVPPEVKKERLFRVQELQARLSLAKNRSQVGRILPVLAEEASREAPHQLTGRAPEGRIVNFDGDKNLIGAILNLEITDASSYSLKGVICSSK